MAKAGTFKFICIHCEEPIWLTRKDRDRRGHKRCVNCGGGRFEEATEYAKTQMANAHGLCRKIGDDILKKQGIKERA